MSIHKDHVLTLKEEVPGICIYISYLELIMITVSTYINPNPNTIYYTLK